MSAHPSRLKHNFYIERWTPYVHSWHCDLTSMIEQNKRGVKIARSMDIRSELPYWDLVPHDAYVGSTLVLWSVSYKQLPTSREGGILPSARWISPLYLLVQGPVLVYDTRIWREQIPKSACGNLYRGHLRLSQGLWNHPIQVSLGVFGHT